ncbi:MAG: MotA/TolQ/ExbB proton channel family protein, partial [Myxococcota bacterium]
ISSGGVIAWIIVGLGMFAMFLLVLRAVFLLRLSSFSEPNWQELEECVRVGDMDAGLWVVKRKRGILMRMLEVVLEHGDKPFRQIEDQVESYIVKQTPRLERFSTMIGVSAAVAPLLGLLGTVTGMIATFNILTEHGAGDPKMLAGGISEALITTELGLVVAIPTLLLGTLLSGYASRLLAELDWASLHMLNQIQHASLERLPEETLRVRMDEHLHHFSEEDDVGREPAQHVGGFAKSPAVM